MKYDMNGDGIKDYIIHAFASQSGGFDCGADIFKVYLVNEKNEYKPIDIPSLYYFQKNEMYILSTKTNCVNDIKILPNGENDIVRYDGKNNYPYLGGYIDAKNPALSYLLFNYPTINCSEGIIVNLRIPQVFDSSSEKPHYLALAFYDNPYLKENIIYSCYPDGKPRIMKGSDKIINEFFYVDGYIEYDFYAELKDGVTIPDGYKIKPVEIRYIPVE